MIDQRLTYPNLQAGGSPSPFGDAELFGQIPAATPQADRRASEALLRDATSAGLRNLLDYLEGTAVKHPEMGRCYQPFHAAIQAYRSRDYGRVLDLVYQIYRTIEALRAQHPDLPEIGARMREDGKHTDA